ncbi:MAG: glycoside hydrolase domain-containing protein, partial [Planctomycetota bacterium]
MQKLDLAGIVFALFVSFCVTCPPVVTADGPDIPMPEMTVTRTDAPPTIDGKMEPGEWDRATACTAFTVASKHYLAPVQSTAYVTYDDEYIYVAIKNLRGEKTPLLEKRARQPDDSSIVFDPSNEIWFTPPTSPQVTYQTLFNAYPGVFDAKMIPSVGYTAMSWSADWEIAASETKNHWIVEGRSKIKAYGSDGIEDGTTWRGLFTADIGDGYGFRAWAPGEGFSKIQRHGTLNFAADAPTFQFQDCETIFSGHPEFSMSVTASDRAKAEVDVSLRFGPDVEPTDEDVVVERTVAVEAGDSATFTMGADLTELNLPEKKLRVKSTGEEGEFPRGYGEVTAKTADGQTLYHQEFPFRITDWKRRPPEQIKTTPYDEDFGIKAKYAPMNKKVLVTVDRHYMEERERVANGKARLVDAESGEVVAQCELDPFYYDYSKFPLDVQHVDVPVETPDEWRAKKEGEGSGEQPDIYNLEVSLTDAEGNEVATAAREVGLMGYEFEWLPNDVGESDKVIKPWTPLKWDDGALSMWNKTYDLNGLGMADNIDNDGAPQLSDMKLVAVVDGEEVEVDPDTLNMQNLTEANADLTGTAKIAGVDVEVDTHAEFDGFVRNTMRLNPQTPTSIDRLSAVFTMPKEEAPLMVSTVGGWYSYHGFTPEKWDSTDVALSNMIYNQVPYVLLTDSDRGFSWFADSVEGWILDEDEPTVELWTENDTVTLRVNFISRSTTLEEPTSMTWGWMVTPQKPQPEGWRNWI